MISKLLKTTEDEENRESDSKQKRVPGGGGDYHIKSIEVLVETFEKNPLEKQRYCVGVA